MGNKLPRRTVSMSKRLVGEAKGATFGALEEDGTPDETDETPTSYDAAISQAREAREQLDALADALGDAPHIRFVKLLAASVIGVSLTLGIVGVWGLWARMNDGAPTFAPTNAGGVRTARPVITDVECPDGTLRIRTGDAPDAIACIVGVVEDGFTPAEPTPTDAEATPVSGVFPCEEGDALIRTGSGAFECVTLDTGDAPDAEE